MTTINKQQELPQRRTTTISRPPSPTTENTNVKDARLNSMTLARSSGLNAVTTPRNTVYPFAKSAAKTSRKTGTRKAKKKKENATAVKRLWVKTNTSSALPEAMKKKRCAECAVMILTKK